MFNVYVAQGFISIYDNVSEEAGIHFVDCIFWWEYAYK